MFKLTSRQSNVTTPKLQQKEGKRVQARLLSPQSIKTHNVDDNIKHTESSNNTELEILKLTLQ